MGKDKPIIAVLSGKGGAGKTFVAVNLAAAAPAANYIDCDVEEPNGHLFLKPKHKSVQEVFLLIPKVDVEKCTACGECVKFCRFNALALISEQLLVFDEICHSCGGCVLTCPKGALTERKKTIGFLKKGGAGEITTLSGILNVGEVNGVPIIERLLEVERDDQKLTIIDCPPGAACSVMESIAPAHFCLLVVEPTNFGFHNFKLVYELVNFFGIKVGVVFNKCLESFPPLEEFCNQHQIPILATIPYDEKLAEINSKGYIAVRENKRYHNLFSSLLARVIEEAGHETVINLKR